LRIVSFPATSYVIAEKRLTKAAIVAVVIVIVIVVIKDEGNCEHFSILIVRRGQKKGGNERHKML